MSVEEHLDHYASRARALPVFGYADHELYGDALFETLDRLRMHHHAEIQLSLGLDETEDAVEPCHTPKGGFTSAPDEHRRGPRHPWRGTDALPDPDRA